MTCLSACWLALVLLSTRCVAYYDAGIATEHIHLLKIRGLEPTETVALPPSLTTEVATISTILGRGHAIYYDVYYDTVSAGETHRIVKDHFKRSGVLANEPPIPTCRPCGTQVTSRNVTQQYTYTSGFTTTPCLTPYPYYGAFGPQTYYTSFCFATTYTGVFYTDEYEDFTLTCCPTFPSCNVTSTTPPSTTYSTGVFASTTTYVSNFTTSTFTAPSSSLFTPSSTRSTSTATTGSGQGPGSASLSTRSSTSSSSSSRSSSSSSSNSLVSTSTYSIIVISSTTITISTRSSSSSSSSGTSDSGSTGSTSSSSSSDSLLTVITPSSSSSSSSGTLSTILGSVSSSTSGVTTTPVTVEGCGTVASGSGTVIGSGVVYPAVLPYVPVTSSGTASGSARLLIGCGTMIGTGTFTGSATITGCGQGNGTATLTGQGTVWPSIDGTLRTDMSYVSSGVLSGSGSVKGCGTLTGSGTFTITGGYTTETPLVTVTKIVSYCGPSTAGVLGLADLHRLAANDTSLDDTGSGPNYMVDAELQNGTYTNSSSLNTTNTDPATPPGTDPRYNLTVADILNAAKAVPINSTSSGLYPNTTFPLLNVTATNTTTNSTHTRPEIPNCHQCPNSIGICCPIDSFPCDSLGKCPWAGIVAMGYLRGGYNMVMARNLSDGSVKPDVVKVEDTVGVREESVGNGVAGSVLQKRGGDDGEGGMQGEGDVLERLARREREFKRREGEEREKVAG